MNSFLFEAPWLMGGIGAIVTGVSGLAWLQTGNAWAKNIALALGVVTALFVWINFQVKTDGELVEEVVLAIAREIENNDHARVRQRIHPDASERVVSAVDQLPKVKFREARITKIHSVEVQGKSSPKSAFVQMNVILKVDSEYFSGNAAAWIQVELEQKAGQWLVVNYEQREPQYGYMNR